MIVVLADDITGAAEIAGICLRYGLSMSFFIDKVDVSEADVCVIATDSRSLTEQEAFECHTKLGGDVKLLHPEWIFKKCDSVLRGFVLAELLPFVVDGVFSSILLMPSNPDSGRRIRSGNYYIGESLINESGFVRDPDFPATSPDVATILQERSLLSASAFSVITENRKTWGDKGRTNIYVPDCSTPEDMLRKLDSVKLDTFLAGSAVFFEQMLKHKGYKRADKTIRINSVDEFLLVAGTAHPDSKAFGERLSRMGCPVVAFPDKLLTQNIQHAELSGWARTLSSIWMDKRMLSVTIADRAVVFPDSKEQLKFRLSSIVADLIEHCNIPEVFIEGGATTYHLLKQLGYMNLSPVSELMAGVLRLKVVGQNLFITIKPGSYLWPDGLFHSPK